VIFLAVVRKKMPPKNIEGNIEENLVDLEAKSRRFPSIFPSIFLVTSCDVTNKISKEISIQKSLERTSLNDGNFTRCIPLISTHFKDTIFALSYHFIRI
jgi:hypothetical protein